MKKIIALILAMAMALALVACGGDNTTPMPRTIRPLPLAAPST